MESHDHDHEHAYDQPATARANVLLWGGLAVGAAVFDIGRMLEAW